ncbi:MAG: hypothetical protein O6952_08810, partial [Planctomycetota bacterium]|nr:hypothetical protein [Planctomycetota bacterium]
MGLEFSFQHFIWAVGLGAISAASLPMGSALGLVWQPRARIIAALTAFGGGALIAALAIELVAPTAANFLEASHSGELEARHEAAGNLLSLIVSA